MSMHGYDHWKTTEPESGYDPPEPDYDGALTAEIEVRINRIIDTMQGELNHRTAQRDKYEAALRKIAAWKGYTISGDHEYERYERGYEQDANDMLSTLQAMAGEALS